MSIRAEMTATPDQVIAKANFSSYKSVNYRGLSDDDAFERFAAGLATKPYGAGRYGIERSLVGAKNDGGIDAMFLFLNGSELATASSKVASCGPPTLMRS